MKINTPVTNIEQPFPQGKYIVSRTDLKGAITYANDAFVEISGFTREELIGKNHNMVRHPDMPPAAFENLWTTVKAGRPWRGIVKNRCKNGNYYWVEALVVPVRKNDQTIGYMSVRTAPTAQQIGDATALYRQLQATKASLPVPSAWARTLLAHKLTALIVWMIVAQLIGGAIHQFGAKLGLTGTTIDIVLELLGLTTVAAGIGLLLLLRQVMTILRRIIGRLDHIAQGDLTDTIPLHRADELGQLNDALVTMQTHLKSMLAEIAEMATVVTTDAEEVNRHMAATNEISKSQSDAAARIAAGIEQLGTSIQEVTSSAQLAMEAVGESGNYLNAAAQRMVQTRAASGAVVKTVGEASSTMAELFQSIFAIGRITQAIKEIAEQTNLLALNAAIEAARAGESGRGFAVVADEVRKLAESAEKQTHEITHSVHEIQRVTQLAVTGMEKAGTEVGDTETALGHAEEGLTEVRRRGDNVVSYSSLIADKTKEQVAASQEVTEQVIKIAEGLHNTVETIAEVGRKTEEMLDSSKRLNEMVGYFRVIR